MSLMWSRREQHQAYQFLSRRVVSAVLSGEPETNELPMRRFSTAFFGGLALAVLVVAGFTIFGLVFPGGGKPTENVIILERETGALYIYQAGQLHPVLNWTSARLILGQATVQTMSRTSLRDVPRGATVGIADAPATLPDKGSLVSLPWSVCSAPRSPDTVDLATHVLAGSVPAGGAPIADDAGLLVTTTTGDRYLLWHNHALKIASQVVVTALGMSAVQPLQVAPAFLNAVPAGPDLSPLALPNAGKQTSFAVTGGPADVGQLFQDSVTGLFYVMASDGLVPVGDVTARLWRNAGAQPAQATPAQLAAVPVGSWKEPDGLPTKIPTAIGKQSAAMVCAAYAGNSAYENPVSVQTYTKVPDSIPIVNVQTAAVTVADHVSLPGGRGALVAMRMPPGSAAPGAVYLVTDQGIKYALADSGAPSPTGTSANAQSTVDTAGIEDRLGYAGVAPVALPALFLDLIPQGPALDPTAARGSVTTDAPTPTPTPSASS
jgi:type VII secretion protein EccB